MLLIRTLVLTLLTSNCIFAQLNPTQTVSIEMSDQEFLAADVYIPDACTSCPTILIQTPYDKDNFNNGLPLGYLQDLQSSPYIWVVVDWRGFYGSSGANVPAQHNRGEDGYDIIEWVTQQAWSDGKVGTWGPSALGVIQYQTMREQHPAHVCAVPLVAHPHTHYEGYFYGGALEKARLISLDLLGYGLSPLVLSNPYHSAVWQFVENGSWYPQSITIPTLQIGGWYDHNIDHMMTWYEATRTQAEISVRDKQWLLVGPWVHGGTGAAYVGSAVQGELTYANAAFESDIQAREFFEYYLLEDANGWETTPLIKYYETGINQWATTNDVSIEWADNGNLYLSDDGKLQQEAGIGVSSFVSDPRNPTPTIGGQTLSLFLVQGPKDQISLESRDDLLVFNTAELPDDYTISGRVKANLFVQCNQPDADIVVRMIDVYPDGRNMLINDGIHRMRFRNGVTQADEEFMSPGEVYEVEVELPFVNYTWLQGHEIKVIISGNSHSRWDVNLQNGGQMYTAGDTLEATISIHHDSQYPSQIILPGVNSPLGITELSGDNLIVYPNPVSDLLYFKTDNAIRSAIVYDLRGNVVKESTDDKQEIDVSSLSKGVYLVQIITSQGAFSARFVKE